MTLIDWLWCFPQMLAGFVWSKIQKAERTDVTVDGKTYTVYMTDWQGAVSLGNLVQYLDTKSSHKDCFLFYNKLKQAIEKSITCF
jgi:hypothetical protein